MEEQRGHSEGEGSRQSPASQLEGAARAGGCSCLAARCVGAAGTLTAAMRACGHAAMRSSDAATPCGDCRGVAVAWAPNLAAGVNQGDQPLAHRKHVFFFLLNVLRKVTLSFGHLQFRGLRHTAALTG